MITQTSIARNPDLTAQIEVVPPGADRSVFQFSIIAVHRASRVLASSCFIFAMCSIRTRSHASQISIVSVPLGPLWRLPVT